MTSLTALASLALVFVAFCISDSISCSVVSHSTREIPSNKLDGIGRSEAGAPEGISSTQPRTSL